MIIDLYAGPGGWDVGAALVGLPLPIGLEWGAEECATRAAAGLPTIRCDLGAYPPDPFTRKVTGLIASPPCPLFSNAGKKHGREAMDLLADMIDAAFAGEDLDPWRAKIADRVTATAGEKAGERAGREAVLTAEVAHWIAVVNPEWVALEQVPAVLPLWERIAAHLEAEGWSTYTDRLNAADYGVPQTRTRAVLLARRDGTPITAPMPTHTKDPEPTLFGPTLEKWVSMAEALGWGMTRRPSTTLMAGPGAGGRSVLDGGTGSRRTIRGEQDAGRWADGVEGRVGFPRRDDLGTSPDGYRERDWRSLDEPAFALTEKARSWVVQLNTGRDWKKGGTREDAQKIPSTEPAPTITAIAGQQFQVDVRDADGNKVTPEEWQLRAGTPSNAPTRRGDEPAPTILANIGKNNGWRWEAAGTPFQRPDTQLSRELQAKALAEKPVKADDGGQAALIPTSVPDGRDAPWTYNRPATTLAGDPRVPQPGHKKNKAGPHSPGRMEGAIKLTVEDALVLQSFPVDWPAQGTRTAQFRQIGNAVPPLLAAHLLHAVTAA